MEPPRLISMEVSASGTSDCYFRILANRSVKYVTVKAGALDAESLDNMPLDFQSILPPLAYYDDTWKSACITRNVASSQLEATLSSAGLPGVRSIWHPRTIDHLDLECTAYLALLTRECKWTPAAAFSPGDAPGTGERRMVAKMARFHWEIQYMEAETRMYQILDGRNIAPRFLGHIHEENRVIGFLLEKVTDGRNAEPADLEICAAALRHFHALGFVHGDCNKYNFIVRPGGKVVLIDFDKAEACADPPRMEAEIASLKEQLAETTGRGGGLMSFDEADSDNGREPTSQEH
ncbi:alpha-galactosidase A [Niveomyces insectorum RCEF 264]|uniref:Alpha-galactosidase A n=1 Tax=Niveomyces insectorum RCEF 264 TaxID=1081102 RepID=A0A167VBN2_9HYPO|nr:alpha-galactosidase A [Niveomyces insectorum RCEF 264]